MSEELKKRMKINLQNQFDLYDKYLPCLRTHAEEIVDALQDEDTEELVAVFKECKIPKKYWMKLIILAKKAYDSEFQSWQLGP